MTFPKFLLGLALLFWGWQTQLWIMAVPLAVIVEGSQLIRSRWDLADEDFHRIANFCLLLFMGLIAYLLIIRDWENTVALLLRWLPILFFPLLAAQLYSQRARLSLRTLFWLKQSPSSTQSTVHASVRPPSGPLLDFSYAYFALCILAASATPDRNLVFYGGMVALSCPLLWQVRSQRFSPIVWIGLLILSTSLGLFGQHGLHQLHLALERQVIAWMSGGAGAEVNPFQNSTAIGSIQQLKQANTILLRVAAANQQSKPDLLRQATYNRYQSSLWVTADAAFQKLSADDTGSRWALLEAVTQTPVEPERLNAATASVTISAPLTKGKGLLKLPDGTFQINDLAIVAAEQNQYRTVKVEAESNRLTYQVQFAPDLSLDSPPVAADLDIPAAEQLALRQLVQQLALEGKPPDIIVKEIRRFFLQNFDYSLDLTTQGSETQTAIATFLLDSRAGHCEYFATATTLLLRAAGIPARYAVGFSVHEFSPLEQQYVVRSRHAHAWTLAYLDGKWQVVDNTPPAWITLEDGAIPGWSLMADVFSWGQFKFALALRQLRQSGALQYWWILLVLVMILVAGRQLGSSKPIKRIIRKGATPQSTVVNVSGADSEFYRLEQVLTEQGWHRYPSETFKQWLDRIDESWDADCSLSELKAIVALHYRYRFDPLAVEPHEREQLQTALQSWLNRYSTK